MFKHRFVTESVDFKNNKWSLEAHSLSDTHPNVTWKSLDVECNTRILHGASSD